MAKKSNGNADSTEVALSETNGAVVTFDPSKFRAGVANMQKASAGRTEFLRMDKAGEWFFGQDDNPLDPDDHLYMDPMGSVHGWQCWADTDQPGVSPELLGTVKAAHYDPMPDRPAEVPAKGREWAEMFGISLLMNGVKLTYTTTSLGGKDAVAALYDQISAHYDEDPTTMIPVVSLTSDWYKHKKYGKTFFPVLNIVDWVATVPAEAMTPAPKAPTRKAPAAPPVPAKKAPAKPARRAA